MTLTELYVQVKITEREIEKTKSRMRKRDLKKHKIKLLKEIKKKGNRDE